MQLPLFAILLFVILFTLSIPIKVKNAENAELIRERDILKITFDSLAFELAVLNKSIDSLRSRERITLAAEQMELGYFETPTKITRIAK